MRRSQSFNSAINSLSFEAPEQKRLSLDKNTESASISSRGSTRATFLSPETMRLAKEALLVESGKRNEVQIESICYLIVELFLLEHLSHENKLIASKIATLYTFPPNTQIYQKNQKFKYFYIIIYGSMVVQFENQNSVFIHPGDHFGSLPRTDGVEITLSEGYISTLDDNCEVLSININDFNSLIRSSDQIELSDEQDSSSIEATYSDNILSSATIEKILETLLDERYQTDEPNFTNDFFLTYFMYIQDIKIIVKKIQEAFEKDIHNQRAIAVLLTWLDVCPQVFNTPDMSDFVIFIALQLKSRSNIALSGAIIETCYIRSLAYEIRFYLSPGDDVPVRFKYRILPQTPSKYHIELFVTTIESASNINISHLKLYDEIIFINDIEIRNLTIKQIGLAIRSISNFILIVKRCPIKYEYVKVELKDLYEIADADIRSKHVPTREKSVLDSQDTDKNASQGIIHRRHNFTPTQEGTRSSIFSGLTLRRNKKKRQAAISIYDSNNLNTQSNSSLRDVGNIFSGSSIAYESVSQHYDTISNFSSDSGESCFEKSSNFIVRFHMSNHEARYVAVSRTDSCRKIIDEYFTKNFRKLGMTFDKNQMLSSEVFSFVFTAKMTKNGMKISRLYDEIFDLPQRIQPGDRFYVSSCSADIKINRDIECEMLEEASSQLKTFDHIALAKILTIYNFNKFSQISPVEYLGTICKEVNCNCDNLIYFEKRFNNELNWVVFEILNEPITRFRVNIIIKFIKIANNCLLLNNFYTFFAILQGLDNDWVNRLKSTWDLIPAKYIKQFQSLMTYCNLAHNMSNYRAWLLKCTVDNKRENRSLMIPLIPIVKKDLTFINDSSQTFLSSNQINYRKIRLFAKELRKISHFRDRNFSLIKSFQIKNNKSSPLFSYPSLSMSLYNKNNSILLSDISSDILRFLPLENLLGGDQLTFGVSQSQSKKYFDDYILIKKLYSYVENIDNLNFDQSDIKEKSYKLEPLKKMKTSTQESDDLSVLSKNSKLKNTSSSTLSLSSVKKIYGYKKDENIDIKKEKTEGTLV